MILPKTPQNAQTTARHYDSLDLFYRGVWGEHVHHGLWEDPYQSPATAVRNLADLVIRQAGVGRGHAVCDIGCGYGATARIMARECGARVAAVTLSEAQHRYAQSLPRAEGDPTYFCKDFLETKFPAACFEAAVAIESTEHFADRNLLFKEVFRVLKIGGRFVVCAWTLGEALRPWQAKYIAEPICREGSLPSLLTMQEIYRGLRAAAFEDVEAMDLTKHVWRTWPFAIVRTVWGLITKAELRRALLKDSGAAAFARTLFRMCAAYATGTLRYVVFTARKPIK